MYVAIASWLELVAFQYTYSYSACVAAIMYVVYKI